MTDVINATPAATSASPGGEVKWIGSAADVSRLINEGSSGRNNARIVMGIALGGIFLDAYDLGSLAFGLKDITREFNLKPARYRDGRLGHHLRRYRWRATRRLSADKIGRYRVFMADMLFFVVAAIACALAPNEYVLTGARFVMGLGVGIDLPVAMAFLSEFARLKGPGNKAASVAMWCPTWYAAISISYLLVLFFYAVLPESHSDWLWRIILGFGAIPALVIIAIRSRYMSESPVWAANQGNLREAASILRQAYNINAHVAQDALEKPAPKVRSAQWSNYLRLFRGVYLRRTTLSTLLSVVSSFAYNAVAFGLPVIISSFFVQSMLTTILISLALNLLFAFVGGILAVRLVPRFGAWRMSLAGYGCQLTALLGLALIGRPDGAGEGVAAVAMLALFLFGQGFGPGAHTMTFASLSYPTSLRGVGVGLNQTLMRGSSTLSLFLFPLLVAALDTRVFWIIAAAPLIGLLSLLAIRWEPSGYDIDAEDYQQP
ncbi:Major facilitator superfamily (MFS) transporter [Klebsiella aerogenes EA1509E]|nr:Major facilitator superfamily (MFS) transporter [Klebsiella aerogenes EA1509E]